MFRWDRICQRIKCNPWSTRFFPHPHHYKEDENLSGTGGRAGTQAPVTNQPVQTPFSQHQSPNKERVQNDREEKKTNPN